jgi:hypothetical protein
MKRALLTTLFTLLLACLTAATASAQNPNYHFATSNLNTTNACLDVSFKETGLGGAGFTTDVYSLACSKVSYTVGCVNKGGNTVQGSPKSGTTSASVSGTFAIRNGQTTGTLSLCPTSVVLPNPGCTGSQEEVILAASYDGCTLSESDFGSSTTVVGQTNNTLFVVVP